MSGDTHTHTHYVNCKLPVHSVPEHSTTESPPFQPFFCVSTCRLSSSVSTERQRLLGKGLNLRLQVDDWSSCVSLSVDRRDLYKHENRVKGEARRRIRGGGGTRCLFCPEKNKQKHGFRNHRTPSPPQQNNQPTSRSRLKSNTHTHTHTSCCLSPFMFQSLFPHLDALSCSNLTLQQPQERRGGEL